MMSTPPYLACNDGDVRVDGNKKAVYFLVIFVFIVHVWRPRLYLHHVVGLAEPDVSAEVPRNSVDPRLPTYTVLVPHNQLSRYAR